MKNLKIPQATGKGYIEVEPYGAFDWTYPNSITRRGRVQMGGIFAPPSFARMKFMCMKTRMDKEKEQTLQCLVVGQVWKSKQNGKVYNPEGICPCICAGNHAGVEPKIIVYE